MLLALAALTLAPSSAFAGTEPVAIEGDVVDEPAVTEEPPADMSRERKGRRGGRGGQGGQGGQGAPPEGEGRGEHGPRGDGPRGDGPRGDGPHGLWSHIRPVGLAQIWGTAWDMDENAVADATGYGDPEDDVGFKIKRFRLGLAGEEKGLDWAFVLGLTAPYDGFDDEDGAIEIVKASVGYEWKGLGVQVGQDEVPFSRDRMIASAEQTFTERGMVAEHIAPDRSLGATVWARRWGAKVTLGVYNSGGGLFGDDNLGKTVLGRLEYTYGDADVYETWGGSRKLAFGIGAGGYLTDDVATATKALGADAIVRVAGLTLLVDGALSDVSPTNTTLDVPGVWSQTTRRGVTGQIGYGIGAFEPAVKVSLYDDSSVGSYTNLLAGVVWHTALDDRGRDRVRIGAGYALRLEDDPIANDTVRLWAQVRP
ncbi:MAG: porin [Pseudomonadota bacterium]|nr:porin [Pseudomonadota bacterium]